MRISDLARASRVRIPTIKFYLREGLLPPGHRTAMNQAAYGAGHVRRLRLIRVLVEVGGLSLASVRSVLDAVDRDAAPLHEVLAAAHAALQRDEPSASASGDVRNLVDGWLERLGWDLAPDSPGRGDLAATLAALRGLGWDTGPEIFERYAAHADDIAEAEIAFVAGIEDRAAAVEATVIGTILFERAFATLRRLAHERHSRARLAGR